MSEDLRFPVGKFEKIEVTDDLRQDFIKTISELPNKLREAVNNLNEEQLETQYRPEGWTIKQVVHHIADSHANSLIRFKLVLTEDVPPIKPYMEDRWAELADGKNAPIDLSLKLIDGLHGRWTVVLQNMSAEDFDRKLFHPEHGEVDLNYMLSLYEWHCRHHLAHITNLKERNNW